MTKRKTCLLKMASRKHLLLLRPKNPGLSLLLESNQGLKIYRSCVSIAVFLQSKIDFKKKNATNCTVVINMFRYKCRAHKSLTHVKILQDEVLQKMFLYSCSIYALCNFRGNEDAANGCCASCANC